MTNKSKCTREIQNDFQAAFITQLRLVVMNVKRITSTCHVLFSRFIHCWYRLGEDFNVTRSTVSSNGYNAVREGSGSKEYMQK